MKNQRSYLIPSQAWNFEWARQGGIGHLSAGHGRGPRPPQSPNIPTSLCRHPSSGQFPLREEKRPPGEVAHSLCARQGRFGLQSPAHPASDPDQVGGGRRRRRRAKGT